MGVLDKVRFWKKNDDFGLGDDLGLGKDVGQLPGEAVGQQQFGSQPQFGSFPQQQLSQPQFSSPPPFPQQSYAQPSFSSSARDLDLVSAKLDALKATLESINQRLANLERIAEGETTYQDYAKRRGW